MKKTRRLEHKYIISYADYFIIRDGIKALMHHDKHGEEDSYPVISVYLDDIVFNGASDKAFGNETHKKYRIRYYHDESVKKLELKYKQADVSTKYSCTINEETYRAIITNNLDVLETKFDEPLIRRYTLDTLQHNLEPKIYIKYKREAYKDFLDNIRITFDHSLYVERFLGDIANLDLKLLKDTDLIMEIKYEKYIPYPIKQLIKKINVNQIAYSKYFLGFNSLEL